MRLTTLMLMVLLLSSVAMNVCADPANKIGFVNAEEVLLKSKKGVEIQKRMEELRKAKEDQITGLQNAVKQQQKQLASPALSIEAREQGTTELQAKQIELRRVIEDAQRDIQKETYNALEEFQKQVMPIIQNYGKSNGFTAIYDVSSSGLAYFDPNADITNDIIKEVDARL